MEALRKLKAEQEGQVKHVDTLPTMTRWFTLLLSYSIPVNVIGSAPTEEEFHFDFHSWKIVDSFVHKRTYVIRLVERVIVISSEGYSPLARESREDTGLEMESQMLLATYTNELDHVG